MKAFWYSTKTSLLKSWPPGVGWGHNRGNCFYKCLHKEKKKHFENLKNHCTKRAEIYIKALWHSTGDNLLKSWPPGSSGATIGETVLHVLIKGTYLKDFLLKNQWAQRAEIYIKVFRHSTNARLLKSSSLGVGWGHNKGSFLYLENCWIIHLKTVYIIVPCIKEHQMVCRSSPYGVLPFPLKQEVPKYSWNCWDPHP
jgi:hypothetical protein